MYSSSEEYREKNVEIVINSLCVKILKNIAFFEFSDIEGVVNKTPLIEILFHEDEFYDIGISEKIVSHYFSIEREFDLIIKNLDKNKNFTEIEKTKLELEKFSLETFSASEENLKMIKETFNDICA